MKKTNLIIIKRSYGEESAIELLKQIIVDIINEQKGYEYAKLK